MEDMKPSSGYGEDVVLVLGLYMVIGMSCNIMEGKTGVWYFKDGEMEHVKWIAGLQLVRDFWLARSWV